MKALLLKAADFFGRVWGLLPIAARRRLHLALFVLEGRTGTPARGLKNLFEIEDALDLAINERAMAYGDGVHPKHRLMRYHDFFVARIAKGDRVLDVGCGYGAVARTVAAARPTAEVLGVELNPATLEKARLGPQLPNLSFALGDVTAGLPRGPWDVVLLSNVLEHLDARVRFLEEVARTTGARRVLIRVPLFERDWKMPMRREVGANYLSDPEHFIEHRYAEFEAEIAAAGLAIAHCQTIWGEIWADCRPAGKESRA